MAKKIYPTLTMDSIMPYGKYKGETIEWLIDNVYKYLQYCCDEHKLQLDDEAWAALQKRNEDG